MTQRDLDKLGCVYVDGAFLPPGQARVSVFDHGFLYGDGLFETVRTYLGVPFRLPEHLARLQAGLDVLAIRGAPSRGVMHELVMETLTRSGLDEAYLRITVTRGVGQSGLDPAGCTTATVIVAALPLRVYPEHLYRHGASSTILYTRPSTGTPPPTLKTTSFQHIVMARAELSRRGVTEGFFLDEAGNVVEGTVSNVFAVVGKDVLTPPATVCLPGITRAVVLDLVEQLGLTAHEATLDPVALSGADEVFVTSSLMELLPIARVDGHDIGRGLPGPVYRELHTSYRAQTRTEAPPRNLFHEVAMFQAQAP